ncbi:hypothetical protein AZI86_13300 [Bdellovibrio bacteriovorus]|uniref:Mechanosensitive ion channel protein MscS n=1 Tax=Bdellovibrio bacteriovorus TaxID=959 RepID=A0A150WJD3_BDEBC|nr:mechanosensitive ion channel family protein [Bdellovibrio bacteriovorus]KYG63794.1 hypothetical protein AZI86_13300 [Bdellovibrio bacteriovorus]
MLEQIPQDLLGEVQQATSLGWLLMLAMAAVGTIVIKAALKFVSLRLEKIRLHFKGIADDIIIEVLNHTKSWAIFMWIMHGIVQSTEAASPAKRGVFIAFVVLSALQVVVWGLRAISVWKEGYLKIRVGKDRSAASAIGLMSTGIQAVFIAAVILMCLSNLGVDIAALIAGLGIGGIAVALAAQNILGDLFGSLSIVLDKPFVVGDFIVVGNDMGTVENIGVKTTRLRSLSGEELIFANKDLLESRVKNFKRMYERRAVLNFDISYFTPVEKLQQIPTWIEGFVKEQDLLRFERCHLSTFTDSSLKYELVYWVTDPDQGKYMDRQQALIYKILGRFEEEGISFALGSRSLIIQSEELEDAPRPLVVSNQHGQDVAH